MSTSETQKDAEHERIVEAIQRDKYLAGLAIGTFENYMQYTGKWDSLKDFKELMETHCPNITDFEEMFSHYWGHREGEEEEEEEDVTVDDVASVLNLPIAKEEVEE